MCGENCVEKSFQRSSYNLCLKKVRVEIHLSWKKLRKWENSVRSVLRKSHEWCKDLWPYWRIFYYFWLCCNKCSAICRDSEVELDESMFLLTICFVHTTLEVLSTIYSSGRGWFFVSKGINWSGSSIQKFTDPTFKAAFILTLGKIPGMQSYPCFLAKHTTSCHRSQPSHSNISLQSQKRYESRSCDRILTRFSFCNTTFTNGGTISHESLLCTWNPYIHHWS